MKENIKRWTNESYMYKQNCYSWYREQTDWLKRLPHRYEKKTEDCCYKM